MNLLKLTAVYARALITDEKNWTQGACARRADGEWVSDESEYACRWCAMGAIAVAVEAIAATGDERDRLWVGFREGLYGQGTNIAFVNDTKGHAAVLKAFDRFIEGESE